MVKSSSPPSSRTRCIAPRCVAVKRVVKRAVKRVAKSVVKRAVVSLW